MSTSVHFKWVIIDIHHGAIESNRAIIERVVGSRWPTAEKTRDNLTGGINERAQ